ncbi:septal ring lytic transglycosylase RlpA family protein [Massilia sp. S19_KUP03_FR1]|uniref:septal ring lytic transglycosylase RlpA family protein n=1 Tax=Massilia sp. S19_KUP03_FR1 TaxID=3025503 RepID=UPI002FCCBCED
MKRLIQQTATWLPVAGCAMFLSGCASSDGHRIIPLPWPHKPAAQHGEAPKLPPAGSGRGGYYQGDGPGANPPPNLDLVPDAVFKAEPYAKYANRPYSVFGQTYTPMIDDMPYSRQGVASWYGVKFHGQKTSSGELYDMYKMTAAHPTLPIPSYARITSLESGKQVVVRINDRGPFHSSRLIDVSYTAALKLGLLGKGSHQVQVDRMLAPDPARAATLRREANAEVASAANGAPDDMTNLMLKDRMAFESAALVAPADAPVVASAGFYLQLGAYGRASGAEDMRARLQAAGIDGATLEVAQAGSIFRLFRGPFASRADAQEAARSMPTTLGLKPLVVKR